MWKLDTTEEIVDAHGIWFDQVPDADVGQHVRPGDIVGCDDDGVVVVPLEVAKEVAAHTRAILLADMRGRRELYRELDKPLDETVNVEQVEAYYQQLDYAREQRRGYRIVCGAVLCEDLVAYLAAGTLERYPSHLQLRSDSL